MAMRKASRQQARVPSPAVHKALELQRYQRPQGEVKDTWDEKPVQCGARQVRSAFCPSDLTTP